MHKIRLRPLRLASLGGSQLQDYVPGTEGSDRDEIGEENNGIGIIGTLSSTIQQNGKEVHVIPRDTISTDNRARDLADADTGALERPRSEVAAQQLLKRTPSSYLLNQVYGLWFFISSFLLTIIITHTVSPRDYGVYAVAMTAINTIQYIVAFGFEDAITVYVPRVLAEHGKAEAAWLIRRLLILRLVILVASVIVILYGLPVLARLIELTHISGAASMAAGLRDPQLLTHIAPIAIYVLGSSIANLLTAVCAALMRMRLVLVIGFFTQLGLLGLGFLLLHSGLGINSMLWLLAIGSLFNAAAFALWLAQYIFARGGKYRQPLKPVIQLGMNAWLTNLASGALLKQVSIILLSFFAVSLVSMGYFNLSFQLADAANYLLVAGFGGIGGAALAAAFVGRNRERLGRSWQALIKVETLLATPGLVFCIFNAQAIAHALYGSQFNAVGPLFAIFLFFNILVRVIGTTIHQSSLYVVGKPRLAALSQWVGIGVAVLAGLALIPLLGVAGALMADGIAKTVTGVLMLLFLLRELPRKYVLNLLSFTLRFLLALVLAALPSLLWHPADRIQLGLSGCLFFLLSLGLLYWLKPLGATDLEMIKGTNPRLVRYLRIFAQKG